MSEEQKTIKSTRTTRFEKRMEAAKAIEEQQKEESASSENNQED